MFSMSSPVTVCRKRLSGSQGTLSFSQRYFGAGCPDALQGSSTRCPAMALRWSNPSRIDGAEFAGSETGNKEELFPTRALKLIHSPIRQYFFLLHFLPPPPGVLSTTVCFSDPATSLSHGGWDPAAHAAEATHCCLEILSLDFFQVANVSLVIFHVPCESYGEPEMCCLNNYCYFSTRLKPTHCPFFSVV